MCTWFQQLLMIMKTDQIANQTIKADNKVKRDQRHRQHQDHLTWKDKELLLKIQLDLEHWDPVLLKILTLVLTQPFSKIITDILSWRALKLSRQTAVTPRNSNMTPSPTNLTIVVYMWGHPVPHLSKAPIKEAGAHPTTEALIAHNSIHWHPNCLQWEGTKSYIVRLLIKKEG
jgi:hypothetical protein